MEWQSTHASSVAPLRAKTALPDSFGFKETHDFNVILLCLCYGKTVDIQVHGLPTHSMGFHGQASVNCRVECY